VLQICFTGRVPTLQEGNMMENILSFPWSKEKPVVLGMYHIDNTCISTFTDSSLKLKYHHLAGPRFKEAFQDPNSFLAIQHIFEVHAFLTDDSEAETLSLSLSHTHTHTHTRMHNQ